MVTQSILAICVTLAAVAPSSQREPKGIRKNSCTATGLACLFGSAPGCSVTCTNPRIATCVAARCEDGFPVPARCYCAPC